MALNAAKTMTVKKLSVVTRAGRVCHDMKRRWRRQTLQTPLRARVRLVFGS